MAATVTVVCPQCRNKMKASAQHIGRQGRCPACKALVPIKSSESESLVGLVRDDPSHDHTWGHRRGGQAEVNTWLAAAIGLTATSFLYVVFILLKNHERQPGMFMCENIPIEAMITFVCCWSAALLIMKYAAVRRQLVTPDRELELIPLDIGMQITGGNVDEFLAHLSQLPAQRQDSILLRRIRGALEHFKFRNSVPEVQTYLSTQAEIDASAVDSGYTLLRAFIWVCPILGFVGTVIGISGAMGELKGALPDNDRTSVSAAAAPSASDKDEMEGIKTALKGVTANLATAFNATLLGLVTTILLLFPTELLRRAEYATLDRIEVYANESLLRRMSEGGPALDKDPAGYAREALQVAFQQHQQWLAQWQDQVARLGQDIGGKFEVALRGGMQRVAQDEAIRLDRMGTMAMTLDQILDHAKRATEMAHRTSEQATAHAERAAETVGQLQDRLGGYASLLDQLLEQQQRLVEQHAGGVVLSAVEPLREDAPLLGDHEVVSTGVPRPEPAPSDRRPDDEYRTFAWWGKR